MEEKFMLAVILVLTLTFSLWAIFAVMVFYIGIGMLILLIFSALYYSIVSYLGKITNDKIFIILNRKTISAAVIIAFVLFLAWYYTPRTPINISKDEIEYYTIDSYINGGKSTVKDETSIEKTLRFLDGKQLHRTIKRFTTKEVDTSGFVLTFYTQDNEVISTIQMVHGEVIKIDGQYYKTYSIKKDYYDIEELKTILDSETRINFKEIDKEAFNSIKETARYENGILYFTMPTFKTTGVSIVGFKGSIDFINGGATKKTVYFLEDYLKEHGYNAGTKVEIPIKEQIGDSKFYNFDITFDINNLKCTIDFTDMLPKDLVHN